MSPEYGATCGFFPVDDETLRYLRLTGRPDGADRARRGVLQGERALARPGRAADVLAGRGARPSSVEPSLAGPRRPQDRVPLREAKQAFLDELPSFGVDDGNGHDEAVDETFPASDPLASGSSWPRRGAGRRLDLHGAAHRARRADRGGGDLTATRRSTSATAPSSSPRSRPARTRPTRP